MPVLPSEVKFYQSLQTNSLGGAIAAFVVPTGLNLFYADVDLGEALLGSVAYRCFYIKNESADTAYTAIDLYVSTPTPNASTSCELGLGTSAVDGTEQTIISENTAPSGVAFYTTSVGSPLTVPDLAAGEYKAVWIKRTVLAEAVGSASDYVVLTVSGTGG